ncbi:MAG: aldo/keto reductase, partial [Pirellulales bacterium]|nr:aldo/keto reductase [Pirellulales bacterium]
SINTATEGRPMQYRTMPSTGDRLSALGLGCMRLPTTGKKKQIDRPAATRLIHKAIDAGINYLDTAFPYHNGQSELLLGEALQGGYRERVKLATKLPHWLVREPDDMSKLLARQHEKLRTDQIDYYLVHMVSEQRWQTLKTLGIVEFLEQAKRQGRVGHIGFSFHGGREEFKRLVDDYDWEFVQIQYNYLDTEHQAGREGLQYAASKGLGLIVMEPLRGGNLAKTPPKEIQRLWNRAPRHHTPVDWALRWVWNHPEVHVVLSGMTSEEQLDENLRTVDEAEPNLLTPDELALIDEVAAAYRTRTRAGCTGCQYCMPCPAGVDIPNCLQTLDSYSLFGNKAAHQFSYMALAMGVMDDQRKLASQCTECGKCTEKCPQQLPIPGLLKEVSATFEGFAARLTMRLARFYLWFVRRRSIR